MKDAVVFQLNRSVKFCHRDEMRRRATFRSFQSPSGRITVPTTTLPVDSTGSQTVSCPMDGNDTYGDCGEAMAAHADNILTFGQGHGSESVFDSQALVSQYLEVSGGDNGLDEADVVALWKAGIAGNPEAIIVDSLDIDVTAVPLAQFALDNFYTIQMAWSVPDQFLKEFSTGVKFVDPGIPDPSNGHFVPLADVDSAGLYSLWTWGTYCWVSPAYVSSVQPQCFVVFSPRQFDPATGLDSKGRHITAQAALWVQCGGQAIPDSVIARFPPAASPVPSPGPSPIPSPIPPVPSPAPNPVPTPVVPDVVIDPVGQVITLPTGITSNTWGLPFVALMRSTLFAPKGWIVKTSPSNGPAATPVDWSAIIEQVLQLVALLLPGISPQPPASTRPKGSPGTYIATPGNLEDVMSNNDFVLALQSSIEASGLTDPGVIGSLGTLSTTLLSQGASDLTAFAATKQITVNPTVTHDGIDYVISNSTPAILVVDTPIPASSVPVAAPAPSPPPTPA